MLLFGIPQELLEKLQRVQNAAARIVTRAKSEVSPSTSKGASLVTRRNKIEFKIALLAYKCINGTAESAAESLRLSPTISEFRKQLKTHFCRMAFPN